MFWAAAILPFAACILSQDYEAASLPGAESRTAWWIPSHLSGSSRWGNLWGADLSSHPPLKLRANQPARPLWDPRSPQHQKSGWILKLYLLQRRDIPSYSPWASNQLVMVLFSERFRNLWRCSLRTGCNHSSELSARQRILISLTCEDCLCRTVSLI